MSRESVSPQPLKRKTKIILKRYNSNMSVSRPENRLTSVMHQYLENKTNSSDKLSINHTISTKLQANTINSKLFEFILVPESLKDKKGSLSSKKGAFSYPLPPKSPALNLEANHRRHRTSLVSNVSSAFWKTEGMGKEKRERPPLPMKSQSSFYETFNER